MDLADQIDDYICTIDGVSDLTMDTLAMVVFAWAVIALFSVWLCKFLYNKYGKKKGAAATAVNGDVKSGGGIGGATIKAGMSATAEDILRKPEIRERVSLVGGTAKEVACGVK